MNTKTNTKTNTNPAPKGATKTPVRDSLTTQYKFWIETREVNDLNPRWVLPGVSTYTEWTGLTAKRAKDMYAYTHQSQPSNVTSFGWEEMK